MADNQPNCRRSTPKRHHSVELQHFNLTPTQRSRPCQNPTPRRSAGRQRQQPTSGDSAAVPSRQTAACSSGSKPIQAENNASPYLRIC